MLNKYNTIQYISTATNQEKKEKDGTIARMYVTTSRNGTKEREILCSFFC
jgi:hypothetical protein